MKLLFQLLFVAVFVAVLSVEAGKPKDESDSVDVLEQTIEEFDGEEDEIEVTTALPDGRRGRGPPQRGSKGGKGGRHNHRGAKTWRKNMTPDEKFEFICQKLKFKSNFLQSRRMSMKLSRMDPEVREKIQTIFQSSVTAMSECCLLNVTEGVQCAANRRNERFTKVCNGEQPLNIWSLLKGKGREAHTNEKVTKCCELQGDARNTCFLAEKQKHVGKVHGGKHGRNRDQ